MRCAHSQIPDTIDHISINKHSVSLHPLRRLLMLLAYACVVSSNDVS